MLIAGVGSLGTGYIMLMAGVGFLGTGYIMLIAGVGSLGTGYNVDSGCWLPRDWV
jgi:hypothetical protein